MLVGRRIFFAAAVVLAICGLLLSNVSPVIEANAVSTTTVTLTTSKTNPAVNQGFTLSGQLTANGVPLAGKTVYLLSNWPPGTWVNYGTVKTDSSGKYSFSVSESSAGAYAFQVGFNGDAQYAACSAGRTLDVGSLKQSTINIFTTNSNPNLNQSFSLYGVLTDGVTGAPLAGQSLKLIVKDPSGHTSSILATTLSNGSYSFKRAEGLKGTYSYQVWFLGNSKYFECDAMIGALPIGDPIQTSISVSVSNSNPAVGQTFTFSGYLKDGKGNALSGKKIAAQECYPTGNTSAWRSIGSATTDTSGHFSITRNEQTSGEYWYEFWFVGDGNYATASTGMYVPIGTLTHTVVSLNSNINNPAVGQSFKLSGYLKAANGAPLAGQEVDIGRSVAGKTSVVAIRFTDQNGFYFLNWNETIQGSYRYTATYNGDQTHSLSTAAVAVTVGTLTPTTLTLKTSNASPAVNQKFTLSGTLTAKGTSLAGKKIILLSKNPAGQWTNRGSTTTSTSGSYSFSISEASAGSYTYQTDFPGDSTYNISYAGCNANVVS